MRTLLVALSLDHRGQVVGYSVTETAHAPPARPIPRAINRTLGAIRSALRAAREACRA